MNIPIAGIVPIEDPAYRYKMPRLQTKIEGRGNGIKTVVVNMFEVATALHRDPGEVTKFFGCELGAQTSWSDETHKSVVNGSHQTNAMQSHLSRYIESFVLCKNCRLPETEYKVKNGLISQRCAACGAKESVDMEHRLTTFILNAYKKSKKDRDAADKKSKKDKKDKSKKTDDDKKAKKKSKKRSTAEGAPDGGKSDDSNDEEEKLSDAEPSEAKAPEDDAAADVIDEADGPSPADDVTADVTETESPVDEQEEYRAALNTAIERFGAFLSNTPTAAVTSQLEELRILQTFHSLRTQDKAIVFVGATFGPNAIADHTVHTHKPALKCLCGLQGGCRHVIAALEWVCACRHTALLRRFPVLLKHFYDEDVIDEEVFLQWAEEGVTNEYSHPDVSREVLTQLHASAEPFITWLNEAEEDDGDDDA